MDPLATILRSVRLESALLSRASLAPPFAVESAGARTTIFHAVLSGSCLVQLAGSVAAERLAAGEAVVVGPRRRHIISDAPGRAPVSITTLVALNTPSGVPLIRLGASREPTRILCGTLELDHPAAEGFLELLPDLLALTGDESAEARFLSATLALLDDELERGGPGAAAVATRLADVILVLALRRAATAGDRPLRGWTAAARDDHVGRALALIHRHPERAWTAAMLAAEVGLSRTRFFERFSDLVGEAPARYLSRWRVQTAADLLKHRDLSTLEIAERVGYSSEDALGRVFKRYVGSTMSAYRRRLLGGTSG